MEQQIDLQEYLIEKYENSESVQDPITRENSPLKGRTSPISQVEKFPIKGRGCTVLDVLHRDCKEEDKEVKENKGG